MALDDPKIDPAIEAQLYGPEPTLANVAPAYGEDPWSWVPTGTSDDDEEIRRAMMQHIGSAPPQVGGVPLAAYAGMPPPPPMVPTDIVPPDGAPLPLDSYAGYPAPPPLELAGNPWLAQPPAPLAPPIPYGADLPVVAPGPRLPPGPPPGAAPAMPPEYKPPPFDSGAANPFAQYTPDESYKIAAQLPPEEQLKIETNQANLKRIAQETAIHQAALDNLAAIKQNFADRKAADARTQAKEDQIMADSQALAAKGLDRNRWFRNADTFSAMAAVGGALIGGLMTKPGQPNQGVQFISNIIDKDIEDQKYDIENKRADLSFRQAAVAKEFARTGDLHQAAETVRQASYLAIADEVKTRQQDFDAHGTQYLEYGKGILAMKAHAAASQQVWNEKDREYNLKAIKEDRENQLAKSTIAKNAAETAKLRGEIGGAGVGSNTNPNYTVASGFFNPFTNDPIMGKRQIGGKGEGEKERRELGIQIATYGHVQDYWSKLATLGDKIGYAKSLGESAWKARRGTLEAEYDAAKEALTVYLTKELGDKLTQGQLEAQAHRIPDRASVFEARDPGQQIVAAQEDADRDFARDMNLMGLDANPVIRAAQAHRARVRPSSSDDVSAAQQALAGAQTPTDRLDAKAKLDAAKQRLADENVAAADTQHAIDFAEHTGKRRQFSDDGLTPEFAADVQAHNTAAEDFNLTLKKYHQAASTVPAVNPKLKGESAKVASDHEREVARRARDVAQSRVAADHAADDLWRTATAQLVAPDRGGLSPERVDHVGRLLGLTIPSGGANDINRQVEIGKFDVLLGKTLGKLDAYQRGKVLEALLGKAH